MTEEIKSKTVGWKSATRLALVGDKVALKTTQGECWFRPKKLSNAATDEIAEVQREFFRDGRAKSLSEYSEVVKKLEDEQKRKEAMTDEERSEFKSEVSQAQMMEMLGAMPALPVDVRTRMQREMLLSGVGEHNFGDESGKLVQDGKGFDEKTVEEILEWGPLADEICSAIQKHNAPLARRSNSN